VSEISVSNSRRLPRCPEKGQPARPSTRGEYTARVRAGSLIPQPFRPCDWRLARAVIAGVRRGQGSRRWPRSRSMAGSRSVAIARFSTKASAPAAITASRTLCSSWTLRTTTLSPEQRCRTPATRPGRCPAPGTGPRPPRRAGGGPRRRSTTPRRDHDHGFECRLEQPAHAFRETVVTVGQQNAAERLVAHRGRPSHNRTPPPGARRRRGREYARNRRAVTSGYYGAGGWKLRGDPQGTREDAAVIASSPRQRHGPGGGTTRRHRPSDTFRLTCPMRDSVPPVRRRSRTDAWASTNRSWMPAAVSFFSSEDSMRAAVTSTWGEVERSNTMSRTGTAAEPTYCRLCRARGSR